MNKASKALVTLILLVAFGAAAYFSVFKTAHLDNGSAGTSNSGPLAGLAGKLTGTVPVEELSGVIALAVEP